VKGSDIHNPQLLRARRFQAVPDCTARTPPEA
jgi:hypothetical protein